MDRQLQIALIVERHRRHLAERVFAVEHPAVGAAQQRVGDVAKSDFHRGARTRRRPRALDPLPLQIARDFGANEIALARILDRDRRAADDGVGIEEANPLALARPIGTSRDARGHDLLARGVEARQILHDPYRIVRDHVAIISSYSLAEFERHPDPLTT